MRRDHCHGFMTAKSVRKSNTKPVAQDRDNFRTHFVDPSLHKYNVIRHHNMATYCDKCGRDFCDATRQTTHREKKGSRLKQKAKFYQSEISDGMALVFADM